MKMPISFVFLLLVGFISRLLKDVICVLQCFHTPAHDKIENFYALTGEFIFFIGMKENLFSRGCVGSVNLNEKEREKPSRKIEFGKIHFQSRVVFGEKFSIRFMALFLCGSAL